MDKDDFENMTPEQKQALAEYSEKMRATMMGINSREQIECGACNRLIKVNWHDDNVRWDVECTCGWNACGSCKRRPN